jgi:hypothetical protein
MEQPWVTYRQAAEQLGCSVESVRVRAIRNRWPRTLGNDRKARIQVPEGVTISERTLDATPNVTPDNAQLVSALEEHVRTLKEQLATESARADRAIAAFESLAQRLEAMAAQQHANQAVVAAASPERWMKPVNLAAKLAAAETEIV